MNAAGPQATDQQRGKSRWPGSENESYAASGAADSSVSILRCTSGQSNGNENEANGTSERGSVNTDTGLYSLRDLLADTGGFASLLYAMMLVMGRYINTEFLKNKITRTLYFVKT